jgi:hypothetical protein
MRGSVAATFLAIRCKIMNMVITNRTLQWNLVESNGLSPAFYLEEVATGVWSSEHHIKKRSEKRKSERIGPGLIFQECIKTMRKRFGAILWGRSTV